MARPNKIDAEDDPTVAMRSADRLLELLRRHHPDKDEPTAQLFLVDVPKFLPRRTAR